MAMAQMFKNNGSMTQASESARGAERVRADLHYHGPIGFEPYFLKVQGYSGKNLLKEVADAAFARDIGILAITSEHFEIPKGSVRDRFGQLVNQINGLPPEYRAGVMKENILVVERDARRFYLVNGQTVIPVENGRRFDHLVVGTNQVPNRMSLNDTVKYCNDYGLLHGLEHMYSEGHFGIGEGRADRIVMMSDFVEGHNSQLIFDKLAVLPILKKYSRKMNERAQNFAVVHDKPWTANSDGHRIEDAGVSSIILYKWRLKTDDEAGFLGSLREAVRENHFSCECGYEKIRDWFSWVSKFKIGISRHRKELESQGLQ